MQQLDDLDAAAESYTRSIDAVLRTMTARTDLSAEQKLDHAEKEVSSKMMLDLAVFGGKDAAKVGAFVATVEYRARQIRAKRPVAANLNEA